MWRGSVLLELEANYREKEMLYDIYRLSLALSIGWWVLIDIICPKSISHSVGLLDRVFILFFMFVARVGCSSGEDVLLLIAFFGASHEKQFSCLLLWGDYLDNLVLSYILIRS